MRRLYRAQLLIRSTIYLDFPRVWLLWTHLHHLGGTSPPTPHLISVPRPTLTIWSLSAGAPLSPHRSLCFARAQQSSLRRCSRVSVSACPARKLPDPAAANHLSKNRSARPDPFVAPVHVCTLHASRDSRPGRPPHPATRDKSHCRKFMRYPDVCRRTSSGGNTSYRGSHDQTAAGCPSEQTPEAPRSVHMLRPGDIAVVSSARAV